MSARRVSINPVDEFSNKITWRTYLPLIFSLFYFISAFYTPFSWLFCAVLFSSYIAFFLLYTLCHKQPHNAWAYIIIIGLIVLSTAPINATSNCLLGFASYYAGYTLKRKVSLILFAYLIGCLIASAYLSKLSMMASLVYSGLPTIGIYFFGFFDKKRKEHLILYNKQNAQIENLAKIAEREKMARDMHDILGHSLTAIALKGQLASKLLNHSESDKAKAEVDQIIRLAQSSLEDVREAISNYKKRTLSERLVELKQNLLSEEYEVSIHNTLSNLKAEKESAVVLLITEAVTNILKHSNGHSVVINLTQHDNKIIVIVEDNGQVTSFVKGNGLIGMEERVHEIGGEVEISWQQGFKIKAII